MLIIHNKMYVQNGFFNQSYPFMIYIGILMIIYRFYHLMVTQRIIIDKIELNQKEKYCQMNMNQNLQSLVVMMVTKEKEQT